MAKRARPTLSLTEAIEQGNLDELQRVLAGRTRQEEVRQAITTATKACQPAALKLVLDSKKWGSRNIHEADLYHAVEHDHAGMVRMMLPHIGYIGLALCWAARGNRLQVLPLLLPRSPAKEHGSALFHAAEKGHEDALRLILPYATEEHIRKALYQATKMGQTHILPLLTNDEAADLTKTIHGLARSRRWSQVDEVALQDTPEKQKVWVEKYGAAQLPQTAQRVLARDRQVALEQHPVSERGSVRQRA